MKGVSRNFAGTPEQFRKVQDIHKFFPGKMHIVVKLYVDSKTTSQQNELHFAQIESILYVGFILEMKIFM